MCEPAALYDGLALSITKSQSSTIANKTKPNLAERKGRSENDAAWRHYKCCRLFICDVVVVLASTGLPRARAQTTKEK